MFQTNYCRVNHKAHFTYIQHPSSSKRAVCEIMWKNMVQPDWPQMAIYYDACVLYAG